MLELTTQALVCLLQAQPILADQVPSLGHIPRLCRQMAVRNSQRSVYKAAILVLHQLATSEVRFRFLTLLPCMYNVRNYINKLLSIVFVDLHILDMPNGLHKSAETCHAVEKRHDRRSL